MREPLSVFCERHGVTRNLVLNVLASELHILLGQVARRGMGRTAPPVPARLPQGPGGVSLRGDAPPHSAGQLPTRAKGNAGGAGPSGSLR